MSSVDQTQATARAIPAPAASRSGGGSRTPAKPVALAAGGEDPGERRCLMSEYLGVRCTDTIVTAAQALQPRDDVDCLIDEVHGGVRIRGRNGRYVKYRWRLRGLGVRGRSLLAELMACPGEFLDAIYLTKNPLLSGFHNPQTRAQAIRRLRKAFHDSAKKPWYFHTVTHRWAAMWDQDRTWRIIEPLAE